MVVLGLGHHEVGQPVAVDVHGGEGETRVVVGCDLVEDGVMVESQADAERPVAVVQGEVIVGAASAHIYEVHQAVAVEVALLHAPIVAEGCAGGGMVVGKER